MAFDFARQIGIERFATALLAGDGRSPRPRWFHFLGTGVPAGAKGFGFVQEQVALCGMARLGLGRKEPADGHPAALSNKSRSTVMARS